MVEPGSHEAESDLPAKFAQVLPERYRVSESIGRGSFGQTWLATDSETGQPCVVKQLNFQTVDAWKSVELFEREARVLAQLSHPRIPRFLGFYSQADATAACLVQSFVPGHSLKDRLESGRRFSETEAISLAKDLLEILIYLQDLAPPVIHRDIKPGNIILDDQGRSHLVDFGAVSENLAHRESGGSTVVGTFGYMPPEQLDGRAVPGTDLYGLGATLIHVLSGIEPQLMEKENLSLNFKPYVEISPGLGAWLERMTHPDWKLRFLNAREALAALDERDKLARPAADKRKIGVMVGLVTLLLLGLGGGAALMLFSHPSNGEIQGSLQIEGDPKAPLPAITPRFWMRDEASGKRVRPEVEYAAGKFTLRGLPPGTYGLNVTYDVNAANPLQYPGDLRAWQVFEVKPGMQPLRLELPLRTLIHLKTPVDNGTALPGWGGHCQGSSDLSGPQTFSWDTLSPGLNYDYKVLVGTCGQPEADASRMEQALSGRTSKNSVRLELPPTPTGKYYRFRLEARNQNAKVGGLILHGETDHDWDFRFRVK